MPRSDKKPAKTAEQKNESRHQQWWYPKRCEVEGCEVKEGLSKCGACCMVMYCCKEHQREDWPQHKEDCKVFQRVGARATFYEDEEMLAKFPLTPPLQFNQEEEEEGEEEQLQQIPPGSVCPLCNRADVEVHLKRTRCCGQIICDTTAGYQLMSYSRDFCERSHDRYTLCGYHGVERTCDKTKDWRECSGCKTATSSFDLADTLWRGLNPYNFCPLQSKDVPRHSLCERCERCGRKYISGMEGCSISGGQHVCLGCSGPW